MRGDYMLSAVTKAVSAHFGEQVKVYNEAPVQNIPKEYIIVHQINREQTPDNYRFHKRFYFFDVRFHPNTKESSQNKRIAIISEGLHECLTFIETDDQPVRASAIRAEVQDGILHVFADYPVRVILPVPEVPDMQILDLEEHYKKEE